MTNSLLRPGYQKNMQEIILDSSRAGVHLPQVIEATSPPLFKTRAENYATSDKRCNLSFNFWNTQRWYPRVQYVSSTGRHSHPDAGVYLVSPSRVSGKVISTVLRPFSHRLGIQTANPTDIEGELHMIASKVRDRTTANDNTKILESLFDMLGAFKNESKPRRLSSVWGRLHSHGGEITGLYWNQLDVTKPRKHPYPDARPMIFIDSLGRLLFSYSLTWPGDMVVEIAGGSSLFIVSSPYEHFSGERITPYDEYESSLDRELIVRPNRRCLFIGACSVYPGKTTFFESRTWRA